MRILSLHEREEYDRKLLKALERTKLFILYPELYEQGAKKLQEQDKTLVYNDEEMEETECFQNLRF